MPKPAEFLRAFHSKSHWIISLFFGLFCIGSYAVSGPFWLGQNGDVNYVYLLSGLDYLNFQHSGINDQPAIVVKLVNALIIGCVYLFRYTVGWADSLPLDVIQHSELYLSGIALTVFIALMIVVIRFLKVLQHHVKSEALYLVAALSFLLSSSILLNVFVNKPEPYLVIAGLWLGKMVVLRFKQQIRPSNGEAVGLLLFALLSKVTVLPFLVLLVYAVGLRHFLQRIVPISLLCLLPFLLFFWIEIKETAVWVFQAAIRREAQGQGDLGFYAFKQLDQNFHQLVNINKGLLLILGLATMHLVIKRTHLKLKLIFILCYIVFFVFILKEPNTHYFVICYAVLPSFIIVQFSEFRWPSLRTSGMLLAVAFLVVRGYSYTLGITAKANRWKQFDRKPGVESYYTSSKPFALFMANSIQYFRHSKLLFSIYPTDTFYHVDHQFYTFEGPIKKKHLEGKKLVIRSTCKLAEEDAQLEIISKQEYDYTVRVKE